MQNGIEISTINDRMDMIESHLQRTLDQIAVMERQTTTGVRVLDYCVTRVLSDGFVVVQVQQALESLGTQLLEKYAGKKQA